MKFKHGDKIELEKDGYELTVKVLEAKEIEKPTINVCRVCKTEVDFTKRFCECGNDILGF